MKPAVSVVIPCFNAGKWISRALLSALSEPELETEIIVVDDGSTDNSWSVISGFTPVVRCLSGERRGPSAARNRGLNAASAEKVLFLDADDYIEGIYLTGLLGQGLKVAADLTFGGYRVEDSFGTQSEIIRLEREPNPVLLLRHVLAGRFPQTACVMWDTHFLRSIGGWREDVRLGEDIELLIRALVRTPIVAHSAVGHIVHVNHDGPERLTRKISPIDLEWQFKFSSDLLRDLRNLGDLEVLRLFGLQHYNLAKIAFSFGSDELGHKALRRARELGFIDYTGTRPEIALAKLLGVKHLTKCLSLMRRSRRFIQRMRGVMMIEERRCL